MKTRKWFNHLGNFGISVLPTGIFVRQPLADGLAVVERPLPAHTWQVVQRQQTEELVRLRQERENVLALKCTVQEARQQLAGMAADDEVIVLARLPWKEGGDNAQAVDIRESVDSTCQHAGGGS